MNRFLKKISLMLLVLPAVAIVASSCDDDDDLPQVTISLAYSNAVVVDDAVYVVKPDVLNVDEVKLTAVREGHAVTNGPVAYYFDGVPMGVSPVWPFGIQILTENIPTGRHDLSLSMTVAEEGCELATLMSTVSINVVDDAADIPEASGGVTTQMNLVYTLK